MNPTIKVRNTGELTETQKSAMGTLFVGSFGSGFLLGGVAAFILFAALSKT